jgi:hypothetical protein
VSGPVGPMNAVFFGAFSAIPAGYVIKVKQKGPHGTITGENGSSRSKWTSAVIFRICSTFDSQDHEGNEMIQDAFRVAYIMTFGEVCSMCPFRD